jgi:site-specific DNA recombinase
MRAAIYIRVSSEEQVDNWSLGAQLERCQEFADSNGWDVVKVYEDAGFSAKSDQRPALQQLLRDAESGKFEALIIYKLDRLSRRQGHMALIVERLVAAGVRLASATEHLPWENILQRDLIIGVHGLIAQIDNQNRAMETTKGKAARARAGYWNGSLSFGYTTVKLFKKHGYADWQNGQITEAAYNTYLEQIAEVFKRFKHLTEDDAIPDPTNAGGLVLAFEYYSQGGVSDRDVGNLLNALGYRPSRHTGKRHRRLFGPDTIRDMLQNRFYLAETQYKGEMFPGRHPALISEELFELCQETRRKRRIRKVRGKAVRSVYPLSRIVYCARCQEPMRGQPNHRKQRYYRDAWRATTGCTQPMVRADATEATLLGYLSHIQLPDDWRERVLALTDPQRNHVRKEKERQSLQMRLERLRDLYKWGEIERDEYLSERETLKTRLTALRPSKEPDLEEAVKLLENIGELLKQATLGELDKVFHALFERVYIDRNHPGHIYAIEPKPPLHRLMDISLLPRLPDDDNNPDGGGSSGNVYKGRKNDGSKIAASAESGIINLDELEIGRKQRWRVMSVPCSTPVAPDLDIISTESMLVRRF